MRNKTLITVFVFLVGLAVFNMLVLFQIPILSPIFVGLFMSFAPGFLLLSSLQNKLTVSLEEILYSLGLSLAFLLFQGLGMNWLLPLAGVRHPISFFPLIITFSTLVIILLTIFSFRRPSIQLPSLYPKLSITNMFFLAYSLILPIISVFGAITLNNNGSNTLALIMLASIGVCIFGEVMFSKKIDEKTIVITLLTSGIALLLSTSLRSYLLSGHDVITEYHVFQLVKMNGYWNVGAFKDAYNACLSITILPTIFDAFLKINDMYIYKVVYQIIFSFTSLIVYVFLRKFLKDTYASLAAFFYTAQYTFLGDFPFLARQEIATIFFTLSILLLFNASMSLKTKKILLVVFLLSMVLSHYTTSYIAIGFFLLTYCSSIFFTKILLVLPRIRSFLKNYTRASLQSTKSFPLTPVIILILIVSTYFWNSQVTHTTSSLTNFFSQAIHSRDNILSNNTRSGQTSIFDQFNIFYKADPQKQLMEYIHATDNQYKKIAGNIYYPSSAYVNYHPYYQNLYSVPLKEPQPMSKIINFIEELDKKIIKVLIVIGIFYLLFFKKHKSFLDIAVTISSVSAQIVLLAFIIIPYATVDYNLMRVYQQVLIVLALPAFLGALRVLKPLPNLLKTAVIVLIFGIYYLSYSQFIPQLVGGEEAKLHLNNSGLYYDEYYTHAQELSAGQWLKSHYDPEIRIYTDRMTANRLVAFTNINPDGFTVDVLPELITKDSYVFSSYTQTTKQLIIGFFNGDPISYNYPTDFLNSNKNLIYNNGGAKVYK